AGWDCCRKWDLDYFSFRHGDNDILLVEAEGLTGHGTRQGYEILSVRDLIDNIRTGGDKYLRFSPLIQQLPSLEADLDLQWLSSMRPRLTFGNTFYLFIGGRNTVTHLHNDQPCNLFVQIHGRKKWTLYSVEHSAL